MNSESKYQLGKEQLFLDWAKEEQILRRNREFLILETEAKLYLPMSLLKREVHEAVWKEKLGVAEGCVSKGVIGRIDLIVRFKGKNYACEVKWSNIKGERNTSEFWDSLKVLGYAEYYNWQNNYNWRNNSKLLSAIVLPKKHYRLEHFIVANRLKIKTFGVSKHKDSFLIEEVKCPRR